MGKKKSIYQWSDPVLETYKKDTLVMANQPGYHWVAPIDARRRLLTIWLKVLKRIRPKLLLDDKYYTRLSALESTNDPKSVNSRGYIGRYQMGAGALVDTGYLKKEAAGKGNKAIG